MTQIVKSATLSVAVLLLICATAGAQGNAPVANFLNVQISQGHESLESDPLPPWPPGTLVTLFTNMNFMVIVTDAGKAVDNLPTGAFALTNHISALACEVNGTLLPTVRPFIHTILNLGGGAYILTVQAPSGCNVDNRGFSPLTLQLVVTSGSKQGQAIVDSMQQPSRQAPFVSP